MSGSGVLVEATDLSRWYGEVVGLNHVTFTIPDGVTGLLGPNGSGKSTLLNLVTGQIKPSGGTLRVLGQDPWANVDLAASIGFVPETDAFWEWMTGRELVTRLTRMHGFANDEAERRAARALALVQLDEDAWDRPVGGYSRGMRQKVKIAQAMAHDPPILILDEPLTGADPQSRRHINRAIRERADSGVNVIVSSHVLHEIEALTQEILVLSRGRLVARGNVSAIRSLMDEHPHRVRVEVSDPRRLARLLLEDDGIVSVRVDDKGILLETRQPDRLFKRIPKTCLDEGIALTHLNATDVNLQAVFDYLFEHDKGAES